MYHTVIFFHLFVLLTFSIRDKITLPRKNQNDDNHSFQLKKCEYEINNVL